MCCFIGAVGAGVTVRSFNADEQWYLQPLSPTITFDIDNPPVSGTVSFFTFVILFSQMIPISLYVTMEMVSAGLPVSFFAVVICFFFFVDLVDFGTFVGVLHAF